MPEPIPHRDFPCVSCPWRTDTTSRTVYDNLADYTAGTVRTDKGSPELGDVMFACHRSEAELCAGWLAVSGVDHPTVRLALVIGALPRDAVEAGPRWPALFDDADTMLATHRAALAAQSAIKEDLHGR